MTYTLHLVRFTGGHSLTFFDKNGVFMLHRECATREAVANIIAQFESGFFKDELGENYLSRVQLREA